MCSEEERASRGDYHIPLTSFPSPIRTQYPPSSPLGLYGTSFTTPPPSVQLNQQSAPSFPPLPSFLTSTPEDYVEDGEVPSNLNSCSLGALKATCKKVHKSIIAPASLNVAFAPLHLLPSRITASVRLFWKGEMARQLFWETVGVCCSNVAGKKCGDESLCTKILVFKG